jgi:glycosyltransferase involved in cell wall biosynthesis
VSASEPLYVEVTALLVRRPTGIGRFVARLVASLARLTPLRLLTTVSGDTALQMDLSTSLLCGEEIAVTADDVPAPIDADLDVWARRLLERPRGLHDGEMARRSAGLFTLVRPPGRHFRRELCILYDFTPLVVPRAVDPRARAYFGAFSETLGLCDKAIAISRATEADAGWLCPLPAEDVVVAYPGPSLCVHAHASAAPVARRDTGILVVSSMDAHKNGRFLLDWFVDTDVLAQGTELWWVGAPDGAPAWREWRRRARARGRTLSFLERVTDARLCELYRQAAFVVHPSLYEGFGFPVLDALRHETPVACSFTSSLQEFAGRGVFYFDPCDPLTLDRACRELVASTPLRPHRPDLDERFSWDTLARAVVSLCE